MVAFGSIRACDDTWTAVVADEDVGAPDSSGCFFLGRDQRRGVCRLKGLIWLGPHGFTSSPKEDRSKPK
jgi:hypothetical protein